MFIQEEIQKRLSNNLTVRIDDFYDYAYIYKVKPVKVYKKGKVKVKNKLKRLARINIQKRIPRLMSIALLNKNLRTTLERGIIEHLVNRIKSILIERR